MRRMSLIAWGGLWIKLSQTDGEISGWEVFSKRPLPSYWYAYGLTAEPPTSRLTHEGWLPHKSGACLCFWQSNLFGDAVELTSKPTRLIDQLALPPSVELPTQTRSHHDNTP